MDSYRYLAAMQTLIGLFPFEISVSRDFTFTLNFGKSNQLSEIGGKARTIALSNDDMRSGENGDQDPGS